MRAALGATALGAVTMTWGGTAEACGGTFCDRPPPAAEPMPVDQSGENVLFVVAKGFVEAHVQIQYEGDPERFAWLVPVPEVPEVSIGSQQLFVDLLNATVPTFQLTTSFEVCSDGSRQTTGGCSAGLSAMPEDAFALGEPNDQREEQPADTSVLVQSVGAFEVAILEPTSADDVSAWLDENGFLQDPDAPAIIEDYIEREHVFVAVKLRAGAGTNEIHPLVLRYPGSEPCIPLKLTAIAATEDMPVRAFFLGERRVLPTTYRHVELNELLFDYTQFAPNYMSSVALAVDAPGAEGRAFITEYAGSSAAVDTTAVYSEAWNASVFETLEPVEVMSELRRQGLVTCAPGSGCESTHPLLGPLLERYLPVPEGVAASRFYECPGCYSDQIDPEAWDGTGFAAEFSERIVEPGRHARQLVESAPYLTRLLTTISPEEMTEDPMFAEDSSGEAPDVSPARNATMTRLCDGRQEVALADGRIVYLDNDNGSWPDFQTLLPAAERVTRQEDDESVVLLADEAETIEQGLEQWNDSQPPLQSPRRGNGSSNDGFGCGCAIPSQAASPAYWLAAALALLVARRRR